jgi:hypothetical protein
VLAPTFCFFLSRKFLSLGHEFQEPYQIFTILITMSKPQNAAERKREREKRKSAERSNKKSSLSLTMPLRKENYLYIAIGVAVIIASYVLMALDNNVDGFISLTLCPILLIGAYAWIVYAILYQPKSEEQKDDSTAQGATTASKV